MENLLASIAVQFPLIVLFIWYNDRKDKQFQAFLKEQREEYISALRTMTASIESHDKSLEAHDKKTDLAIAKMFERTGRGSKGD